MDYVMSKSENPTTEELNWYMNQYTQDDLDLYHKLMDKLPIVSIGSLGPHSLNAIREICKICQPTKILEIGFNVGHSSLMWLTFSDATVYSVDNSDRPQTFEAFELIKSKFGSRFHFLNTDSTMVRPLVEDKSFDFAFVDGDHTASGVKKDLDLVQSLGINTIAMDDYWPMFSAAQEVLPASGYQVVNQWGNIVLCKSLV